VKVGTTTHPTQPELPSRVTTPTKAQLCFAFAFGAALTLAVLTCTSNTIPTAEWTVRQLNAQRALVDPTAGPTMQATHQSSSPTSAPPACSQYTRYAPNQLPWGMHYPDDFHPVTGASSLPDSGRVNPLADMDVLLWHINKAGGTSLREAVGARCRLRGWTLRVEEGSAVTNTMHSHLFGAARPLSVITLRHPVARAESAIRNVLYSRKQRCATEPHLQIRNFNCSKPMSVEAEIGLSYCKSEPQSVMWPAIPLVRCVQESYVKALIGTDESNPTNQDWREVTNEDFEKAKARLANFDVILITEWLDWPETELYLNSVFGVGEHLPLQHKNSAIHTSEQDSTYPAKLSSAQLNHLDSLNHHDLRLYAFAQLLAQERMDAAGFGQSLTHEDSIKGFTPSLSIAGTRKEMPCWNT